MQGYITLQTQSSLQASAGNLTFSNPVSVVTHPGGSVLVTVSATHGEPQHPNCDPVFCSPGFGWSSPPIPHSSIFHVYKVSEHCKGNTWSGTFLIEVEPNTEDRTGSYDFNLAWNTHCGTGGEGSHTFCYLRIISLKPGNGKSCDPVGDPVEPFLGNFIRNGSDVTISGRGQDFTFERIYGSQEEYVAMDTLYGDTLENLYLWRTPLGFGWTHSYNIFLDSLPGDSGAPHHMILHDTDGNELDYKYEGGVYKSQTGDRNILKRSSGTP